MNQHIGSLFWNICLGYDLEIWNKTETCCKEKFVYNMKSIIMGHP